MIHKVYDEQKQLFLDFLSCFIAQEHLQIRLTKELLNKEIADEAILLPLKSMFIRSVTEDILSNSNKKTQELFLKCAREAYIACGSHLQKTLPLSNKFLKCASAIDPTARGHHVTCQRLQQLPSLLPTVLTDEEKKQFSLEIFQYQVDIKLPSPVDTTGQLIPIDSWWSNIFTISKYTTMSKIVKAVLSCFHGPLVEGTFNMMKAIIDKRSGKMQIETYSAIQTVKHKLLAEKKSAVEYFARTDYLHQPVDFP